MHHPYIKDKIIYLHKQTNKQTNKQTHIATKLCDDVIT